MNKPVAPANAAGAAGAIKDPVLFLKTSVAPAAVEVWKEEDEGKRGVRDRLESGYGTSLSEDKLLTCTRCFQIFATRLIYINVM